MEAVRVHAYPAPAVILLAMDWEEGSSRQDFLGFAVRRTPGFRDPQTRQYAESSWLPNRIGFEGSAGSDQPDFPSNVAPIQKFMWWDARVGDEDRAAAQAGNAPMFRYEVWPVVGIPGNLQLLEEAKGEIGVALPAEVENGIGTWFNRAVLSSQSFLRKLEGMGLSANNAPNEEQKKELRRWLANGLETVVPDFLKRTNQASGAIYHLTDQLFIVPAFDRFSQTHPVALVYDAKPTREDGKIKPSPNEKVVEALGDTVEFFPRDKANIMHNKFLVSRNRPADGKQNIDQVVTGSANYTTEGLSSQANLMHTFDSKALADLYYERFELLKDNPALAKAAEQSGWSESIQVGEASVRVIFSPEHRKNRESIDAIVDAVNRAGSSVLFCLYSSTDAELRDACFKAGDGNKMMFGLVNHIKSTEPANDGQGADELAALELYHRSRDHHDVIGADCFHQSSVPEGFDPESLLFPHEQPSGHGVPIAIHHKFIVIDAETDNPIIYSGSANMSNNSMHNNDENLLEIRGSTRLASIYLAEFFRLYEHYRARATLYQKGEGSSGRKVYKLKTNSEWAKEYYLVGTPECKERQAMARALHQELCLLKTMGS